MRRRRKGEEGFAVLIIFVLAAALAISLYMQFPRAAFESQRNKEDLLIQRGEQYQRAIQLYYRKFRKYPAKLEDLENTNNIRFLRRRFIDPMTGKDEWRLIHISGPGVFTDSLTRKPPKPNGTNGFGTSAMGSPDSSSTNSSSGLSGPTNLTSAQQPGSQQGLNPALNPGANPNAIPGAPQPISPPAIPGLPDPYNPNNPANQNGSGNPALRRRPSDRPGAPGATPAPGGDPNAAPNPNDPTQQPQLPGVGALPPIPMPGQMQPTTGAPNGQPYNPTTQQPNVGGTTALGNTSTNGSGGTAAPTDAGALIMRQLTQGNPNGAPGGLGGATAFGAGIAGVATKYEGEGIKIYNDHTKYNEWEFIYDPAKEQAAALGAAMGTGQQPQPGSSTSTPTPTPAPTPAPNN